MDAAAQELEQVQGRVIRPVHVLQHHQRGRPRSSSSSAAVKIASALPAAMAASNAFLCLPRDIVQRRERPRRE